MKKSKRKPPKIYLDASVIIAALLSKSGGSSKIIELSRAGIFVAVTSQTVIEEVENHTSKIKKEKREIEEFIAQSEILVREAILLSEIEAIQGVDTEDAHLIAGARLTGCDFLVTLDKKHLLREDVKNTFNPLKIVNPKELLENFLSSKLKTISVS